MIWRLLSLIGLFLITTFTTPLLSLPLAIWYAVRYFAPELILVGAMLDSYFNVAATWPHYTVGAGVIVLVSELVKRHLIFK